MHSRLRHTVRSAEASLGVSPSSLERPRILYVDNSHNRVSKIYRDYNGIYVVKNQSILETHVSILSK
jgi:hypothetical protein